MASRKNGLEPTTGSLWRRPREQGVVVELPSGNKARLRPVPLDLLILSGKLPDLLTPLAAQSLWNEQVSENLVDQVQMVKGYAELVNIVVRVAMLDPKVVDNPQAEDELALEDIDFSDKQAIFQLAYQPASVLEKFRDQQVRSLEAVSGSQNDQSPTE